MTKRRRKYIPLPERLAAALAMLLPQEQRDDLRSRKVPAKVVIALFHQDHNVLHALDGPDRWWNLTPMLRAPHEEKSRRDISIVAKVRRIEGSPEKWRNLLALKSRQDRVKRAGRPKTAWSKNKRSWGFRPWPEGRKIPSRPFPKHP